jgi:hypothetical protein
MTEFYKLRWMGVGEYQEKPPIPAHPCQSKQNSEEMIQKSDIRRLNQ